MRSLDAAELVAIAAGTVSARDLISITAFDRNTNEEVEYGFWADDGITTFEVVDGITGLTEERTFYGSGAILEIGAITLTTDLSIRPVDVTLSPLHTVVEAMVRGHSVRNGRIQIFRVYISIDSGLPVAAAKPRFVGVIDEAPIITAEEGGESTVTLSCVSRMRELTRTNVGLRSNEDQKRRDASDAFYKDTATVGDWELFWGQTSDKADTTPAKSGFFARWRERRQARRGNFLGFGR